MARGTLPPMTCPVFPTYLSVRTFACAPNCVARMRPVVWPAFTPACTPALALALAPAPERPARPRLVRPVSVPTSHTQPSARVPSPPARPPAALPACLSRAGRRVLSPRRLIDFRLGKGWPRLGKVWPRISRPSRVFSRDGGAVGRCPLHARACQDWGLGCRHRRRQPVRDRS